MARRSILRSTWGPVVAALVAGGAGALLPGLAAPDPDTSELLEFTYRGDASADGAIDGTCRAGLVHLAPDGPGWMTASVASARIRIREESRNETEVPLARNLGIGRWEGDDEVSDEVWELGADEVRLTWGNQGNLAGFSRRLDADAVGPSIEVSFATNQLGAGRFGERPSHAAVVPFGPDPENGAGRMYGFGEGVVGFQGDYRFILFGGRVETSRFSEEIPPQEGVVTQREDGPFVQRTVRTGSADLELYGADIRLEAAVVEPYCEELAAKIRGNLTLYDAEGRRRVGDQVVPFEADALTLAGEVDFVERLVDTGQAPADPAPSPSSSLGLPTLSPATPNVAHGAFSSSLPHVSGEVQRFPFHLGVLAGAAAAGLGWALWKVAVFLFSRFDDRELFDSPRRKRIQDVIRAQPGIRIDALGARVGLHYSTLRHHLRLLRRANGIRMWKVAGVWRLAPPGADLPRLRWGLQLEADPTLGILVRHLQTTSPLPAREALRRIEVEAGLSPSGARKVVRRGLRLEILQRQRSGAKTLLQLRAEPHERNPQPATSP